MVKVLTDTQIDNLAKILEHGAIIPLPSEAPVIPTLTRIRERHHHLRWVRVIEADDKSLRLQA